MQALLLIPSVLKKDIAAEVREERHPRMDYDALADGLRSAGAQVRILDYEAVDRAPDQATRLARRWLGRDVALALLGFRHRQQCDVVFTNGENVAVPLALLFKTLRKRPGHVTIGHRLSTRKKQLFFRLLRVQNQIDTIFVYARTQLEHAVRRLAIPPNRVTLIPFHADARFYRPLPEQQVCAEQVCSAGLEWRDYPTLIEAVREMPDLQVRLAAASPWSKHRNETEDRVLPAHVSARRYSYGELRELYATSSFVVVPLYETDFQAGVTTLLEAMAVGKAVIVTRTTGHPDVIVEGQTGLTVAPGDVEGLRSAINRLRNDPELRDRLGRNARCWILRHATLDRWVEHLIAALRASAPATAVKPGSWAAAPEPHA